MNFGPLIFLGIFFTMSLSWLGLVLAPNLQIGGQQPEPNEKTGQLYPQARSGIAHQGAEVYRANGCFYCHSQQVRPQGFGSDIERGWGVRRTVAADYLFDSPVMAGSQRIGPDLTNVGLRQADVNQLLLHLYNPKITLAPRQKSNMPSYPYLFEKRKLGRNISPDALKFPSGFVPEAGYEIVPRIEARVLVEYLRSLRAELPLIELPSLTPDTNVIAKTKVPTAATTNAPQTSATNSPAK